MEEPSFRDKDVLSLKAKLEQHQLRRDEDIALLQTGIQRRMADRPTKGFLSKVVESRLRHAFRTVRVPAQMREGCPIAEHMASNLGEMAEALRNYWADVSQSPDRGFVKPPRDVEAWDLLLGHIQPILTAEQQERLGRPISIEELAELRDESGVIIDIGILRSLPRGKGGGQDGWTYEFIQLLWPTIGPLMIDGWNEAWTQGGRMPGGGHVALLHLLFKPSKNPSVKADPSCPENYRPLSLLNCDSKILSRVLVHRLLKVIHLLIHSDQSGFIPGRSIEANIRIQHDVTHFFETMDPAEFEVGGKFPGGVGRIDHDFEKAYDRVDIEFLIAVCEKMGLGPAFSAWIRLFYKDSMSCILVNGLVVRGYRLVYGVRQGDPLSPLLFDIVMETLAILVRRAPDLQSICLPCGPGWIERPLRILLYADDFNHFFRGSHSIPVFRQILQLFQRASNLKTKPLAEVGMWWGPPLEPASKGSTRWLEGTNFDLALGIRFGKKVTPEIMCEPLIARFEKAIKSLDGMSRAPFGRAVLAQSLVVPIVVYYARVIVIPAGIIDYLQKLVTTYLWTTISKVAKEGREKDPNRRVHHLVGDKGVMRPRNEGGLPLQKIASIVLANQASVILRWFTPQQTTAKGLPRYWVSAVGFPVRLGFSHLLSSSATGISPAAPLFYHQCIEAFNSLKWALDVPQTWEELCHLPLWCNNSFGCLDSTNNPWITKLSKKGVRYMSQMASQVDGKLPRVLPADPSGLRRNPDGAEVPIELDNRLGDASPSTGSSGYRETATNLSGDDGDLCRAGNR
jgi:hypothetical protein